MTLYTETRHLIRLPHGRQTISQDRSAPESGYIHLLYTSRAFEWVPIKRIFQDLFEVLELEMLLPKFLGIRFGWRHLPSINARLYRPRAVFCDFSIDSLFTDEETCICHFKRFSSFRDTGTRSDTNEVGCDQNTHVRTTECEVFRDKSLRVAVACGLNHIPLEPTSFTEVLKEIEYAWDRIVNICGIDEETAAHGRPILTSSVLLLLQRGAKNKRKGKRSEAGIWTGPAKDEVNFLQKHFYFSGLDKAANNFCMICIQHIRVQALKRLQSPDFLHAGTEIIEIVSAILEQMSNMFPEIEFGQAELPYIMATYKLHKTRYRWITNAASCIFSCPASIVTQALLTIMVSLKRWAKVQTDTLSRLFGVDTSAFWVIDSAFEFALDLPGRLDCMYIADITRCYEAIPLSGDDNLPDALEFVIRKAFKFHHQNSGVSDSLWVHINTDLDLADKCCWRSSPPRDPCWIEISLDRLLEIQMWLINSCFIRLGDHAWRQVQGIPMGFSCSPLWCNLYFMAYEFRFILRLARLQQHALLGLFRNAYRYIDDLCILNNKEINRFLDPDAARTTDNPFWIYPLNVVTLQPEMGGTYQGNQSLGTHGHFLNMALEISNTDHGIYSTTKFDKRRSLPFKFRQYIQFASNRPIQQAYNIVISQVLPILYLASSVELAVKEIRNMMDTLHCNGFDLIRLRNTILRFLDNGTFPGVRFDIQILSEEMDRECGRILVDHRNFDVRRLYKKHRVSHA